MGDIFLYVIFGFLLTVVLTCTVCALYVQSVTREKWAKRVCICKYMGAWGVVLARSYHESVDEYCVQIFKSPLSIIKLTGVSTGVSIIVPGPIVVFHSEAIMREFLVGCAFEEARFFVPVMSSQGQDIRDPTWLYGQLHPDEASMPHRLKEVARFNYSGSGYGTDEFVPEAADRPRTNPGDVYMNQ